MEQLFTLGNLVDLLLLVMLQAVLGFDNLLYISLESKRAPLEKQASVRRPLSLFMLLSFYLVVSLFSIQQ